MTRPPGHSRPDRGLAVLTLLLTAFAAAALTAGCGQRAAQPRPTLIATIALPSNAISPTTEAPLETATADNPTIAQPEASTPSTTPPIAVTPGTGKSRLGVFFRSGQTFLTWPEQADLTGERYRIYRSNEPIDAASLPKAQFLAQVGKNSARFYANRYRDQGVYGPRLTDRFILKKGAKALPEGVGLLVWTLAPEDFTGQSKGSGYYAVTVTPPGGHEVLAAGYTTGPVSEAVQDPQPVEISYTPGIHPGPGGHFYVQFMDLRHWNPTFHAPNPSNKYYGLNPAKDPSLVDALAYAYDYSVFEPTEEMCGGRVPDTLPVMVYLHGWRDNRYPTPHTYDNASCAYGVYPIDESQTWYFGFARQHDYRQGGEVGAGDTIENYTEQRVLRMVYDLLRQPPGPKADPQRVYVIGQSMGGTGSLAFAERYPNVFAAAYAGQPITNFRSSPATQDWPADVAIKWGAPELNLPVAISAPGNWAAPLQKYNGVGVWDWQNYQASLAPAGKGGIAGRAADEMAPFGIDHGDIDLVIPFATQAQPLYPLLNASGRAWAGAVIHAEHTWTVYGYLPPTLGKVNDVPFWNYKVRRDETVPGLSLPSSNDPNPPGGPTTYNLTLLWSASWNAWDGPPVDQPNEWRMSFCAVKAGEQRCGSGQPLAVDITPRRLQHFVVKPGAQYDWENRQVRGNRLVASGTVTADASGLLTVKGFAVAPDGSRLVIRPHR